MLKTAKTKAAITKIKFEGSSIAELKIINFARKPEVNGIPDNDNKAIVLANANTGARCESPLNPL